MADGFLLMDKDGGWTSHDVVAKVRRLAGIRKVGHAGTLDPMATGLLVLALGRATRLIRFVQDQPKEYVATAQFGVATDSLDADGSVLAREPMPVDEAEVAAVLPRFTGAIHQVPPMVSALKVGGRRLYELAREGKEVEREPRPVMIHELELVDFAPSDYPLVTLRVRCGKGTYVRSLVADIAQALGGTAHLTALRRTAIGSLRADDALPIEKLAALAASGAFPSALLAPGDGLVDLPAVTAGDDVLAGVRHGTPFPLPVLAGAPASGPFRVLDQEGALRAVYGAAGSQAKPEVVLG